MLKGKNILLGITGSIAAYKAAFLIRLLVKEGAEVKVILTSAASEFITPVTLSTLSKNPVVSSYTAKDGTGTWNNHVELALWADFMLIAPLSANTLAKMATGLCDNVLLATYLSAKCPVYVAPAMDLDMYKHATTRENLTILEKHGVGIIPAEDGELASGLTGQGRMAEPENIVAFLKQRFSTSPLAGKKVLITAGPTYEAIDPVRFIGNHSSGKMGFALAEEAAQRGAEVTLITGPVALSGRSSMHRVDVVSAADMHEAVQSHMEQNDVLIMSAAVADYTPVVKAERKMKKQDVGLAIELKPTTDILASVKDRKRPNQVVVGFALETDNEMENAKGKLERKGLDFIVLNSLNNEGAGFGHDTNKITIISKDTKTTSFELKSKQEVAKDIWNEVEQALV